MMSVYEASITNPKKQLEFYKDLLGQLQQENQELKKQLKPDYYVKGLEGTIKEYQQEMNKVAIQQKEFIKWLENYIKLFDKKDIYEEGSCDTVEEILQKYKEIVGVLDENNKQ